MDNRANAMCSDKCPNEQCNSSSGDNDCFDSEQMSNLVDGWVNSW
jgi:hypothetical protein